MAVTQGSEEQTFMGDANNTTVTPTLGPPPVTPPMGPPLYPTLGTGDLRGKERFEDLLRRMRGMTYQNQWDQDFNTWIMSEKEDPNDPEYNAMLQWAKNNAKMKMEGTDTHIGSSGSSLGGPGKTTIRGTRNQIPTSQGPVRPNEGTETAPPGKTTTGKVIPDVDINKEKKIIRQVNQEMEDYNQTIFKGTPTSPQGLTTETGEDQILASFMALHGKPLPGSRGEYAKRSGAFVYVGTETTTGKSGNKYTRDVYMYYKDASSGLVAQGPTKIKQYQKALGLPESGIDDGQLTGLWQQAVKVAQEYAQAGIKMSVQDVFNNMVRNESANRRGRGGGGGGGSPFIGETNAEVAAIDYYRAMMQVLGDISGLPQPGGAG